MFLDDSLHHTYVYVDQPYTYVLYLLNVTGFTKTDQNVTRTEIQVMP